MSVGQVGFAIPQGHRAPLPRSPGAGLPTRQRRPAMIGLAVLLIAAGVFAGLQLLGATNKQFSVLVLVTSVPAGHVIQATDLASTAISGRIASTPAGSESAVVGRTAARDLFAGQLLTHSMLATVSVPDATHALVGLQLKGGQVPSAGLADSDLVEMVDSPTDNAATASTSPVGATGSATADGAAGSGSLVLATGTVFAIAADADTSGGALVTVLVPRGQAAALSVAASAGQVSLVRVGS